MFTRIQKWGNSQGIRLSRELLAQAGMDVGDAVDVSLHDGTLVVVPARRIRGGHDLRTLVREMPADYEPEELEWDPPAGREVW